MGEGFEPFAEVYVPILLKGTVVTIQVISQSSHTCVRAIILHATPVKCLPRLLGLLTDRSSTLRKNAMECIKILLDALTAYPEGDRCPLERHADALCQAVRAGVCDALAEVRALSRSTFWALQRHFPSRAANLLAAFDVSTHRLVLEEQDQNIAGASTNPRCAAASAVPTRITSSARSGREVVGMASICSDNRCSESCTCADVRNRSKDDDVGVSSQLTPREMACATRDFATRTDAQTAALNERRPDECSRRPWPSSAQDDDTRGLWEDAGTCAVQTTSPDDCEMMVHRQATRDKGMPGDIIAALLQVASSVWSVRAQGLVEMTAFAGEEKLSELVPATLLSKVASAVLEKVSDPHYKVALAAMECVTALVLNSPFAAEPILERLVPQLLLRSQEGREITRTVAQTALRAVQTVFVPEVLFPILVRVMDVPAPRVRIGALGFLTVCCLASPAYLSISQHLRSPFQKTLLQLREKNSELRRAALITLRALFDASGAIMVQQAMLLPVPILNELKAGMREVNCSSFDAAFAKPKPSNARTSTEPPMRHDSQFLGGRHAGGSLDSFDGLTPSKQSSIESLALTATESMQATDPEVAHVRLVNGVASSMSGLEHFNAEDWAAITPSLLRQLSGPAPSTNQRDALLKIQKLCFCVHQDAEIWSIHFEHVLEAILRSLQHEDPQIRELAISCCKDLLRAVPQRFRAFTEHVLLRMLAAGRDEVICVSAAAEEALEPLLTASDSHRCMAVLVPVVMKEGPPTLQLAVRLQSKLINRFTQVQLLSILPQILPPLFEAFKNPNADVRKAVVFCLVDMYMILGEQLTPHLAILSTSQLKLVTIYIDRVRVKQ